MFKFHSTLRKPETNVRHAQSHQRAGASSGYINIIQNTSFLVYEVEHQKIVGAKLGKQTIWFSEVIKELYHYFRKNRFKEKARKPLKQIKHRKSLIWSKDKNN